MFKMFPDDINNHLLCEINDDFNLQYFLNSSIFPCSPKSQACGIEDLTYAYYPSSCCSSSLNLDSNEIGRSCKMPTNNGIDESDHINETFPSTQHTIPEFDHLAFNHSLSNSQCLSTSLNGQSELSDSSLIQSTFAMNELPFEDKLGLALNSKQGKSKGQPRIKKDEMWKSVLRPFRQHFQKMFASMELSKGKSKWKDETVVERVDIFAHLLLQQLEGQNVSDQKIKPLQKQTLLGVFLLLFTSRNKYHKVPSQLQQYFHKDNLVIKYWSVFNNNNDEKLRLMFSDPFLQALWKYWARDNLKTIITTLPEHGVQLLRKDFNSYKLNWPFSQPSCKNSSKI